MRCVFSETIGAQIQDALILILETLVDAATAEHRFIRVAVSAPGI